ncbi:AAA family ATPase [Vibrio sp. ZSDZ34]|uniref:AAA family ATPase n=1 Tax=Vibrio gelatinilyticus TaxID=2893468 RepID=A0A9X2B0G6_9VIBR|nr:AAA family ATPase [Vibrio gelatinilyticus]
MEYNQRVLELESQTELLERIQLLTRFSSNLVIVNGEAGAGKTWLSHRYLEAWAEDKNQALLGCHGAQEDTVRRETILRQLFPSSMYSSSDSLHDSVERILQGEACNVVIVIDDAHRLSRAMLSELWLLVLAAYHAPRQSISVVMFGQSSSIGQHLARLSHGQELKPIELDVDSLAASEARRFFESLVLRYLDDTVEKKVRSSFKKTRPLPGEIMALGEQKMEKRVVIQSLVGSPVKIAIAIAVLVLLLILGYGWLLNKPDTSTVPEPILLPEQTVIPTLQEREGSLQTPSSQSGTSDGLVEVDKLSDDSMALPPAITDQTASVGQEQETEQRVVITSEVVDALLDQPEKTDAPVVAAASPEVQLEKVSAPKNNETQVESVEQLQTAITFSFARESLKALPARSYTLQIAAMTSIEDVQKLLNSYDFDKTIRVYPTLRDDKEWYIVTYDQYATIQAARDAVDSLPSNVKKLGPWAKSMSQVHREIERWKQ